jgi:anthranilate synthase component 2
MKILLIDNYDSFTFNLYHYLSSLKTKVDVVRNDQITKKDMIKLLSPLALVTQTNQGIV